MKEPDVTALGAGTTQAGDPEDATGALHLSLALLDVGWVPPEGVLDQLGAVLDGEGAPEAVRSLAEDLAVARTRSAAGMERAVELVARAKAASVRTREVEAERRQLREALDSRPAIAHAVGMIMLTGSCGSDEAWQALSRLSMATNRKVRDLAEVFTAAALGTPFPPDVAAAFGAALPPKQAPAPK